MCDSEPQTGPPPAPASTHKERVVQLQAFANRQAESAYLWSTGEGCCLFAVALQQELRRLHGMIKVL